MQIYKREIFHFTEPRFGLNKIIDDQTQGWLGMFADLPCCFSKCLLAETSMHGHAVVSFYLQYNVYSPSFIVPGLCLVLTSF